MTVYNCLNGFFSYRVMWGLLLFIFVGLLCDYGWDQQFHRPLWIVVLFLSIVVIFQLVLLGFKELNAKALRALCLELIEAKYEQEATIKRLTEGNKNQAEGSKWIH